MSGVLLSICPACGWRGFPERLWCPNCGSFELGHELAADGVVEEVTTVHRAAGREWPNPGTPLGTARVKGRVAIVARLERAASGDAVLLATENGAVIARHATCDDAGKSSARGRVS